MIETFIGRLLLGWLRAIGRRHGRFPPVPVIPGYAELFPGSAEKIPGSCLREHLLNILIQRMYFCGNRRLRGRIQKNPG